MSSTVFNCSVGVSGETQRTDIRLGVYSNMWNDSSGYY